MLHHEQPAQNLLPIHSAILQLNGHDRFEARDYRYFTRTQVWQYHSGAGGLDSENAVTTTGAFDDTIAVYSFALKPEEHQPSGTDHQRQDPRSSRVGDSERRSN